MTNLEITLKVKLAHLYQKVELLPKQSSYAAKLNNIYNASDNSISGSVKGIEPEVNEESSESNKDASSESKDIVYKCDQCQFTFKRKTNSQKYVNKKQQKNSIKCTKCQSRFNFEHELKTT